MGLDIYLYRYDDFKKTEELEKSQNEFESNIWKEAGEYDSISDENKEDIRSKIKEHAISLGLDKWGEDKTNKTQIEFNHETYPEHLFKIGYFRSSYNSGGIERILKNLSLPTMCDIFNYESGDYKFQPNWENSLVRCEEVIEMFKIKGSYRVHHISQNIFSAPKVHSEKDALDIFLEELKKQNENVNESHNYSNINGDFNFSEPIKVLAMIPGTFKILNEMSCVYVVTESDNTWYIQALEIVRDTIKYVLSKEDKEKYYLHWSG